jgi:hypothetical protein
MALVGDTFYVGNTDGVVAFPYAADEHRVTGPGRTLVTFKPKGLIPSPIDQNPRAQSRNPIDMMRQGWSVSLFHAAQR